MKRFRPTRLAIVILTVILTLTILQMNHFRVTNTGIINKRSAKEFVSKQLNINEEQSSDIAEYIVKNNISIEYIRDLPRDSSGYITIEIVDINKNTYILMVDDNYKIINSN